MDFFKVGKCEFTFIREMRVATFKFLIKHQHFSLQFSLFHLFQNRYSHLSNKHEVKLTNFEKYHPLQKKIHPHVYWFLRLFPSSTSPLLELCTSIFQKIPPSMFITTSTFIREMRVLVWTIQSTELNTCMHLHILLQLWADMNQNFCFLEFPYYFICY